MMDSRRAKRAATVPPARDLSPVPKKKKKKKRAPSTDSSEEEYHRRRKERKRPSKKDHSDDDDEWVVKFAPTLPPPAPVLSAPDHDDSDDSGDSLGPQPLVKQTASKRVDEREYGGSLLRGEGSAMAAFLQDGTESRIPRRGEIGLTSDEIAQFETAGYVMSGNRHRRMNAVRIRKENQVISAEEKRGILKLQKEERERREAILREEFTELVSERLKSHSTSTPINTKPE
ncbi:ras-induced vulval development antagonist-domain-containing protein [Mycena amicta]|nr:ras-induced vulval development antagonist-domain-containing protein [Mycena amicta]